ncbi:MAG TPA: DUF2076 family protein [Acidobacteriaceae bacterium]|nr:DUF2076 family protein [Acidobacteriaceae bacterium]
MTSQEEQMLKALVERVNATKLSEKDVDAENLLAKGFSGNPDAVYILAQSVLVQNIALEQARGQLEQAKQQIEELKRQPTKSGGFLGGLLGHHDRPEQQSAPNASQQGGQGYQQVYNPQAAEYQAPYQGSYPPPQGGYQQAAYPPPPPPAYGYAPPPPPPVYGAPMGGYYGAPMGGGSSFLRGAAQTAAGVAAGALAFEGVEALLHGGFGHPGYGMGMGGYGMPGVGFGMGPGMGMGGFGYERPVEETVINNNYYDSQGGGYEHDGEHFHESSDMGGGQLSDAGWQNDSGSGPNDGFDGGSFDSGDSGGGWDSGSDSGGNFGDDGTI